MKLVYILIASFNVTLNLSRTVLSCQMIQRKIAIEKEGCDTLWTIANMCFGGCESGAKPTFIPPGSIRKPFTDICNICVPGSYEKYSVQLKCKRKNRFKIVKKITSCVCKKVECIRQYTALLIQITCWSSIITIYSSQETGTVILKKLRKTLVIIS